MAIGDKPVNLDELKLVYDKLHVPSVQVQIPTGQWSGSSTRTYTVNATNVTADTIIDWAMDSSINYLKEDLTVTPGSGTIQFSTTAIPAGTINVTLFFPGVKGEVVIQTLADVYSKDQVDQKISQSTANIKIVNVGAVTFSNGTGTKAVSSATTNCRLIAQRQQGTPTSIILTATCSTNGTVTFGAYDASGNGSNYTGELNGIILLLDNRLLS